jgi:hypothetical protein
VLANDMDNNQVIMRAEIIFKHRQEIDALRELLDEAVVAENSSEMLLTAKLWGESLVAVHTLECLAYGFNK